MGRSIVTIVTDALRDAGIRVQRAMPGKALPELESAAVAVQLAQVDQAAATATVLVTVLAPAKLGGASCEELAVKVSSVLSGIGGVCRQEKLEQLTGTVLLEVPVYGKFAGYEKVDGWQELPKPGPVPELEAITFTVFLGGRIASHAVSFSAWRKAVDEQGVVSEIADVPWQFSLKELLPLDTFEEAELKEPFTITVSRSGRTEVYSGCKLLYQSRYTSSKGLSQTREGVAESLKVI